MNEEELQRLTDRVADLPLEAVVSFLLGMVERIADERDALRVDRDRLRTACEALRPWRPVIRAGNFGSDDTTMVVDPDRPTLADAILGVVAALDGEGTDD